MLFWGAERDEVFDFILSFDSLEVEELGKLTYEALCGEHVMRGLAGLWGDPRVVRYTNRKEPCTYEESEERVKLFLENQKTAAAPTIFAICLDEMVIDLAGCPVIDGKKEEFGFFYQLQEYSWGRGIGTRCANWMMAYMEETFAHPTIYADVMEVNAASVKILANLGFLRTGAQDAGAERIIEMKRGDASV